MPENIASQQQSAKHLAARAVMAYCACCWRRGVNMGRWGALAYPVIACVRARRVKDLSPMGRGSHCGEMRSPWIIPAERHRLFTAHPSLCAISKEISNENAPQNTMRVQWSFASLRAARFTCAEGSKSRISKIEIIGNTRMNSANARKKKPSVPKKVM